MNAQDLEQRAREILETLPKPGPGRLMPPEDNGDYQRGHDEEDVLDFALEAIVAALRQQSAQAVSASEVFRIAGGDTECEPNPTPERALEVLRNLRACYDEALCDKPAPVVDAGNWIAPDRMAIKMLVAAGYITDEKANEALRIAHDTHAFALAHQPAPVVDAGNWIAADDVRRLTREIDVALNGEAGAAPQASLCDIAAQVKAEARKRGAPLLAAPVVDDARMARALWWLRDVSKIFPASERHEHLPAIEEAIAAYDTNCGARTARVVDDAMGSLARATLARAQEVQS